MSLTVSAQNILDASRYTAPNTTIGEQLMDTASQEGKYLCLCGMMASVYEFLLFAAWKASQADVKRIGTDVTIVATST